MGPVRTGPGAGLGKCTESKTTTRCPDEIYKSMGKCGRNSRTKGKGLKSSPVRRLVWESGMGGAE